MRQPVYCSNFLCKYYENEKCTAPVLHFDFYRQCKEYELSQEKIDAHINSLNPKDRPVKYGEYRPNPTVYLLRQRSK